MVQELKLIPTRIPAVTVVEKGRTIWNVRLLGKDMEDIDLKDPQLTGCADRPQEEYSDSVINEMGNLKVKLVARDEISRSPSNAPNFVTEGKIIEEGDACYEEGAANVRFTLEPKETLCHGIYEGQIGLFSGDVLIYAWPIFVEVEPNLFEPQADRGGLTVWWVRTAIRDLVPSDESLLDEVEFANYEILHAMRRALEDFNNALPHISLIYTTTNFPWREQLLDGVIGHLYAAAAKLYLRDHLAYSAGGVTIDDKNKQQQYEQLAAQHRERFQVWTKATKDSLNSERFWGVVG